MAAMNAMEIETIDHMLKSNESNAKKAKLDLEPADEGSSKLNDDNDDLVDDVDDDAAFDYDDDDDDGDGEDLFENFQEDDESDYLSMQAQFDNVDLPPGVEASFSFLNNDPPPPVTSTTKVDTLDHQQVPNIASSTSSVLPNVNSNDIASSSSLSVLPSINISSSSAAVEKEVDNATNEQVIMTKFTNFKSFDIVDDFSDHHYISTAGFQGRQPPRTWTKRIQDEWKILEKDLPDSIFVRAYETRMDLLRAVIVGPAGTPYHDGLFVFDIHFPPNYPDTPPMAYYYSGGLRLNPNLYECGKVCLSLLNTWNGKGTEKWMPGNSTMLQVLVSIQALILNEQPFFNEPGHEGLYHGRVREEKSRGYNEDVFILSLKTMVYTLRRPPKHFEDLVAGHFRSRAHVILLACRAYMEGVQVGSKIDGEGPHEKGGSTKFIGAVTKMLNGLVSNFTRYGATDCEQYRVTS